MKQLILLTFLLPTLGFSQEFSWPSLDSVKFVTGRVATEEDVAKQSAIFVLKDQEGNFLGTPIDISLPQYAIYTDGETGQNYNVILIQAESAQGMNVYGAINIIDGSGIASVESDFKLLGQNQ